MLVGILVGAGIFKVTSDATAATGPSVILGYLLLAPVILASAVPYLVFLSTPLGERPGGEVLHLDQVFRSPRLTFLAAWIKCVSYIGAGAYLADALALNLLELARPGADPDGGARLLVALLMIALFASLHAAGVAWIGRAQVAMCAVLALSLAVLIVPGLFSVDVDNLRPFFTGGPFGFASALPMLFFAYAGFESLAQTAGEVRDSRRTLPRVFVRGILITTALFVSISLVAFGVLPSEQLEATGVPLSRAADAYLPFGASFLVTLGAVMAIATSLNATLFTPARLAWSMARDGHLPAAFGRLHPTRGTPWFGVVVTAAGMAALLATGELGLALGIAVTALMILYAAHGVALLALPRLAPGLYARVETGVPRSVQVGSAVVSVASLSCVVAIQWMGDVGTIFDSPFVDRLRGLELTSLELLIAWVALGLGLGGLRRR